MNFCPSCGQQLAEDTRFCPKCGKTVQQETPTEEPAVTNPQPTPEQAPQMPTAAPQGQFPQEVNTSSATPEQAPQRPQKKKKKVLFIIVGVFVFLFIVIIALASGGNNDKPATPAGADAQDTIEVTDLWGYKFVLQEDKKLSTDSATVWDVVSHTATNNVVSLPSGNYKMVSPPYIPGQETMSLYLYSDQASELIGMLIRSVDLYLKWTEEVVPSLHNSFATEFTFDEFDEEDHFPVYKNKAGETLTVSRAVGMASLMANDTWAKQQELSVSFGLAAVVKIVGVVGLEAFDEMVNSTISEAALVHISNPDTSNEPTEQATQKAAGNANTPEGLAVVRKGMGLDKLTIPADARGSGAGNLRLWYTDQQICDAMTEKETEYWSGFAEAFEMTIYGDHELFSQTEEGVRGFNDAEFYIEEALRSLDSGDTRENILQQTITMGDFISNSAQTTIAPGIAAYNVWIAPEWESATQDSPAPQATASNISYEQLARSPYSYIGQTVTFSGRVDYSGTDYDGNPYYSLEINGDYSSDIYVYYTDRNNRVLEDDYVTVTGTFLGLDEVYDEPSIREISRSTR